MGLVIDRNNRSEVAGGLGGFWLKSMVLIGLTT